MTLHSRKSVLFVTPLLDDNSTGRTYCLWLLAKSLGWSVEVLAFKGKKVWAPLASTDFAKDCHFEQTSSRSAMVRYLSQRAQDFDVVVAVKPLPNSLGIALAAHRKNPFPLVVDVDDPDLEARLSWKPLWRGIAWRLRHMRFWLSACVLPPFHKTLSVMTSNPSLQKRYGGILVPHVREDTGKGQPHTSERPVIAFIGTPRPHKGIDVLREAVAARANLGFSLTVTAAAPSDAKPWERWIGSVSLAQGLELVANADIVVIPSRRGLNSTGQLPVKLVDAMLLGRAVVVSDVDPLPWATGGYAPVSPEGDAAALADALMQLTNPLAREQVGAELRGRGLSLFTVQAAAPAFQEACEAAMTQFEGKRGRLSFPA
jgi:glycosyltransferase involved in cell wall biosynthesis